MLSPSCSILVTGVAPRSALRQVYLCLATCTEGQGGMMNQGPKSWLCPLIALRVTLARILIQKSLFGTSLVVQWLRIHLAIHRTWVQSLARELRSHMLHSSAKKKKKRSH